jgi:hypothetical protein
MKMSPPSHDYDVYLSYNQSDLDSVKVIAERLKRAGVKIWLYEWQARPGRKPTDGMKEGLARSASAVVFFGPEGLGPSQTGEVMINILQRAKESGDDFLVIPALLPGADHNRLPPELKDMTWVDFRSGLDSEEAFGLLLNGIKPHTAEEQVGADTDGEDLNTDDVESGAGDEGSSDDAPPATTLDYLVAQPTFTRLARPERDALGLAGAMAVSGNYLVDSIFYLAALLSDVPSHASHVGHFFISALKSQRVAGESDASPDSLSVIDLLNLTAFEIYEAPKEGANFSAEAKPELVTLIEVAGNIATQTDSDQPVIRMRHIIGAIFVPTLGSSPPAALKYLDKLGYNVWMLRLDFLGFIKEYQRDSYPVWEELIPTPADAKGDWGKPPSGGGDEPDDATPEGPPAPEEVERESVRRGRVPPPPPPHDSLGFAPYVKAVAGCLADKNTRPPLTLSIEGEWGSGKSSFMMQLREELRALVAKRRREAMRRRLKELRAPHPACWSPSPLRKLRGFLARLGAAASTRLREIVRRYRKATRGPSDSACLPPPPSRGLRRFATKLRVRGELRRVRCLTVEFNPWRHDKEDALWASFALEFVRKLSKEMPPGERVLAHFKLLHRRFKWRDGWLVALRMAFLLIIIAAMAVALVSLLRAEGLPTWAEILGGEKKDEALFRVVQASGAAGYVAVILFFLSKFREFVGSPFAFDLRKYVEAPDYEGRVAFIEQFHEDFEKVVATYAGDDNKVYVFIDDLDRCDVPKAADLMQAINLMVSGDAPQLVFVIGMDREKVAAGLAVKNEKLLPYLAPRRPPAEAHPDAATARAQVSPDIAFGIEYGYNFIEKFIQLPFSVPQPAPMAVQDLLKYIAPLVKLTGDGGDDAKTDASKGPDDVGSGGVGKEAAGPRDADAEREGESAGADAPDKEEQARQAAEIPAKASPVSRPEMAQTKATDDSERQAATEEAEQGEGFTLQDLGDSVGIHNIVLMAAPALDYNPRRIKQYINLFRLKAYIAYETGLLTRPARGRTAQRLTLEQLGKFVAIGVRWPRLVALLEEERTLLREMQRLVADPKYQRDSQTAAEWLRRPELKSLLKFGCDGGPDPFNKERPGDARRYSLADLDVDKLLQVSPRTRPRALPATPNAAPANAVSTNVAPTNGSQTTTTTTATLQPAASQGESGAASPDAESRSEAP